MIIKINSFGSGACLDLSLSDNKEKIAVATVNGIVLHDAESFTKIRHFKVDITPDKISISPDSKIVAYSSDKGEVFLLDLKTEEIKELFLEEDISESDFVMQEAYWQWHSLKHRTPIRVITFSPDCKFLITASHSSFFSSDFKKIKTQDEIEETLKSKPKYSVVIWDLATGKAKHIIKTNEEISKIIISPDSTYFVSLNFYGGSPKLWNLEEEKLLYEINHRDATLQVSFSPDSMYIGIMGILGDEFLEVLSGKIISRNNVMDNESERPDWFIKTSVSKIDNQEIIKKLHGYTPNIYSLAISPDNKYLAVGGNQPYVNIWDIKTSYLATSIRIASEEDFWDKIVYLDYSINGDLLLIITTSEIKIWDIGTNSLVVNYSNIKAGCGKFSPDGSYVAIGGENLNLSLYEIRDNKVSEFAVWEKDAFINKDIDINQFGYPSDRKYNLSFSHNSRYIITGGSDGNVQVWNSSTGDLIFKESLREEKSWIEEGSLFPIQINNVSFLPDDKTVIYSTTNKLFLLDCINWTVTEVESTQKDNYFNEKSILALSNTHLLGSDLKLYDPQKLKTISNLIYENIGSIKSITVSRDGNFIVTGGEDGIAHVWALKANTSIK